MTKTSYFKDTRQTNTYLIQSFTIDKQLFAKIVVQLTGKRFIFQEIVAIHN